MQREGGNRQRAGAQDVESALDELYTTPPPRFVARREELAAAARADGRAEDARRIHAARRPSLAAWAANLLLRSEPQESRRFLELGQALREAYGGMDSAGVRELSVQRRRVVSELSRQAVRIALEAGHRLSGAAQQDLEATLHAVLADPAAADRWAGGRLESALVPPSEFAAVAASTAGAPPEPARPRAASAPAPSARTQDELAEQRRERRRRLARARTAAKDAEQRLRACRTARSDADAHLTREHSRHDRARQQVSDAERRLGQAREELDRAAAAEREAGERSQAAAEAVVEAEREAREAADEVDRLSARTP
ncbi:hypothetical protein ACIBBD_31360 [Streptomyces sp. NPDC051315]|uniref:hypothetical protein n=1 Tax=Streptomyces sp. NPDC051315 TaxID=3365650 RepID=UPI0037964CD2